MEYKAYITEGDPYKLIPDSEYSLTFASKSDAESFIKGMLFEPCPYPTGSYGVIIEQPSGRTWFIGKELTVADWRKEGF